MFKSHTIIKSAFVVAFAFAGAVTTLSGTSYAATQPSVEQTTDAAITEPNNDIPLEIVPICSDAVAMTSKWTVTNKNMANVTLDWDNFENNLSGTFQATPGKSILTTGYNPADPNNTTRFMYSGNTSATNAQVSPCATEPVDPPVVTCIDGSDQQNLVATFLTKNTVSVVTKDGKLLCNDITIFLSSYIMPDSYNGNGFEGNPTAYPQYLFASTSMTLKKDTDGTSVFTVDLPPTCKNTQIDLYYGPEIVQVGPNGHGTQNIISNIYRADGTSCTPGNGGGEPMPPVKPPVVVTPPITTQPTGNGSAGAPVTKTVVPKVALPTELPETGGLTVNPFLYALALAFVTYLGMYAFFPVKKTD